MKKILVLTDFSENAEHAVRYALNLARQWQSTELILLHTYEPPVLFQTDPSGGITPDGTPGLVNYTAMMEQAEALAQSSQEKIDALKSQIAASAPLLRLTSHVAEGFLGDIVNELTEEEPVDLIVMGIKGKSGLEKILVGSNAIKAIEAFRPPLLIIPEKANNTLPGKIALASDLTLPEETVIRQLEAFLHRLPAEELLVVNVNMSPADPINQEKISALKAKLHPLNPVVHFLQAQNVETGLEEFVARQQISLLAFIHHERSFLGQLFHKSISKQIAWHTAIPVLRFKE